MSISDDLDLWTRSGPAVVEAELGKIMTTIGSTGHQNGMDASSKLAHYCFFLREILRSRAARKSRPVVNFLLGYFQQQADINGEAASEKEGLNRESLAHYQAFLSSCGNGNADMRYFAQWQMGVLQQLLGHPWPAVEESYLKSLEYDVTRGEALKDVLAYRYRQQEWRIAYVYSSYCVRQFLYKPPINRYWGVEHGFYNWRILRYHIPILIAIRKREEAKTFLSQLEIQLLAKREGYTDRDHAEVKNLKVKIEEALSELI